MRGKGCSVWLLSPPFETWYDTYTYNAGYYSSNIIDSADFAARRALGLSWMVFDADVTRTCIGVRASCPLPWVDARNSLLA